MVRYEGEPSFQGGDKVNFNVAFNHFENSSQTDGIIMTIEPEVGPITNDDGIGREVVQIINNAEINSEGVFYTDSNGLDMQKRVFGKQPTFNLQPDKYDVIPASYYPVNGVIYIQDDNSYRMTLLTEKTEGGVSRYGGMIETMVHRRTVLDNSGADDNRGVGEALNELGPDGLGLRIKPQYHIIIENAKKVSDATARVRNYNIDYRPLVMLGAVNSTKSFNLKKQVQDSENINDALNLPNGLKFFLDYRSDSDYYLMRFHNISEKSIKLSKEQLISILKTGGKAEFLDIQITEMSLSNIETLSEMQKRKYDWKTEESIKKLDKEVARFGVALRRLLSKSKVTSDDDSFLIEKYDFRTFRLKIAAKETPTNTKFDQITK